MLPAAFYEYIESSSTVTHSYYQMRTAEKEIPRNFPPECQSKSIKIISAVTDQSKASKISATPNFRIQYSFSKNIILKIILHISLTGDAVVGVRVVGIRVVGIIALYRQQYSVSILIPSPHYIGIIT